MKTFVAMILLLCLILLLPGCLYSQIKTPYDTNLDQTKLGQKTGEASNYSVLWLFAWGDAGTAAAAKDGGLTTINHMDMELLQIFFGFYTKKTTVVYGD